MCAILKIFYEMEAKIIFQCMLLHSPDTFLFRKLLSWKQYEWAHLRSLSKVLRYPKNFAIAQNMK